MQYSVDKEIKSPFCCGFMFFSGIIVLLEKVGNGYDTKIYCYYVNVYHWIRSGLVVYKNS